MHARRSHTRLPMQLPRLMLPGEAGGPDFASGGTALAAGADPPKQHCRDRQAAHSVAGGAPQPVAARGLDGLAALSAA